MTKKHPRRKQEEEESALVAREEFSQAPPPEPAAAESVLSEDDGSALPPHGWKPGGSDGDLDPPGVASPPAALDEHREKYLRLAAEYDNYRKRSSKEREEAGARGQRELVKEMIEALDDLARFAHVDPAVTDSATIVEGVQMVERKLLKTLSSAGLEIVNPVDEQFDPARHEAVSTEPAVAQEDDHTVARVYQPGYVFNGQLLRPARVVVRQWNG
ncbi:MAG TPA: nucleotide exchange factor GrpE [Gemmatimonadaceae bacterium]|nr:nucleotide exchange factor GrpE [Gemmatimonadaceae bacterium]